MKTRLRILPECLFFSCLLIALQGCAPPQKTDGPSVAAAYETSGLLPSQPYTRTIFSSHNF